jgi:DNA-binding transcriptional ArsR family regulator
MLESMRQFKAGIFQALSHPTRVAIVEYLRYGEMSVGRLCEKVGIEQANASQHLAVLRNKHLVETRKEGNQIFYRLRDPRLGEVLETLRQYFLAHINESLQMLKEEQQEANKVEQEAVR